MDPVVFLLELLGFAVALCGLHALRPWLGVAGLYLAVGCFQTMLFVADKGATPISVQLFGSTAFIGYATFLPLLLCATVLVYVLDGTSAARRLLVCIVAIHILHGAADTLLHWHASHPPPGAPWQGDSVLVEHSLLVRASSLGAFVVDFFAILVSYQFLVNRLPRVPLVVPIYAALLVAMVADALVFSTLMGFLAPLGTTQLAQKLQVAAVAALPVAAYLQLQLSRHRGEVSRGVAQRGAFDVLELRRQVRDAEERVAAAEQRTRAVTEAFRKYVAPEVVESMLADPSKLLLGGEVRDVTVLYADVERYTTLAERLSPAEVIEILNAYYDAIGKVILGHGGMIVGIQGDALLAAFGAPLDRPDHAGDAVRAAEGMLAAVDALNDRWRGDGTMARWAGAEVESLAIRIGVHTGPVVAGNVGSEERIEYTLIGDTVNTAARVEDLNKRFGTALLVTRVAGERIADERLRGRLKDLGEHAVRGRKEPVHVFTIPAEGRATTRVGS